MVNFRKIASVVASAVMLGSTLGVAAAANYPAPFVSNGVADVAIVYGSNGAVSDLNTAIKLQTNLNGKVTSTTGSTASSAGGDSISLASSSQKIYMNSTLDVARTILTKDHLPTLLADGSAFDTSGTEYKYTQTLTPGTNTRKVTFGKSSESIDPTLIIDLGYQAGTQPVMNYSLSLTKTLNVSDGTNVVGTSELNILGNKYVVGANSDSDTLYLYGSGAATTVDEGETSTVTIVGKDFEVFLVGTTATNTATVEVNGVRKAMTKGSSYKFADGVEVYLKDVFHATKTGTLSSVDLLVGAKTLHFENGQAVRYGADDTTILGTVARMSATGGALSWLTIAQSAESSIGDYLKSGQSFTDRIFGNIALENVGPVPALDAATRDSVVIDTDNSVSARITFTTAASSKEKTMAYARDPDNTADTTLSRVDLAYDNNLNLSVQEGDNVKVNEYIMVNDNDEGRILQVLSIGAGTSTSDKVVLRDVVSAEEFEFVTGLNNKTTSAKTIGGGEYHLASNPSNADSAAWTINVTWGAGSAAAVYGTQRALFPRIKLKNGEWLSFLAQTTVTKGVTYQLPGKYLWTDYKTPTAALTSHNETTAVSVRNTTSFGNVDYNVTWPANISTGTLDTINLNGVNCIFNATMGPAILIMEEKTLASSNGHAICIPLTVQGTNPRMPAIGEPIFSDGIATSSNGATLQSDSYKKQWLDLYGTLVERDTSTGTNYLVTVRYPDEQMYVDVFFKAKDTTITPGSEGSAGGGNVLIVEDIEVDSVASHNLVVVGGSCVNTVARKMVDATATRPVCGADFTAKTNVGSGQYLLKAVASPYNEDKIAMLIAGYEAADTTSAAEKLKEGHATAIGTSEVYPKVTA